MAERHRAQTLGLSDLPELSRRADAVAPRLLGWRLVSEVGGERTEGEIVEVEAYLGADDPASHAATKGGATDRNRSMFGPPGLLYVYRSYGVHWCANVVTGPDGDPSAVLIRALRPIDGLPTMARRRGRDHDLCSGPGRLTRALGIAGEHDGHDLRNPPVRLVPAGSVEPRVIRRSPRIGISRARERLLRFTLDGSPHLSRR